MAEIVDAVYEDGVLRLDHPLQTVQDHARVKVIIEPTRSAAHPLSDCIGIMPEADAAEMQRIIEEEFEQVNLREWQ